MVAATRDPRPEIRPRACGSLIRFRDDLGAILSALGDAAGDASEEVRLEAVRAIGRLADSEAKRLGKSPGVVELPGPLREAAQAALVGRLRSDRSITVRVAAAESLRWIGPDPASSAALAAATESPDWSVRLAACKSLIALLGPAEPSADP